MADELRRDGTGIPVFRRRVDKYARWEDARLQKPQKRSMKVVLEIHLVVAFLLALCAIIFSWNVQGRRVVNAVAALQFLVGIVAAGMLGASHVPLPPQIWLHILAAVLILACYGLAMRFGKRAGGSSTALAFSVAGLLLVLYNIYLGWQMAGGAAAL